MQQIELSQARQHLADLLNEALKGEEIIFTENNQPILCLTRITEPKPKHRLGQAAGKVWMADNFNETYSGFQLSEERWRKLESLRSPTLRSPKRVESLVEEVAQTRQFVLHLSTLFTHLQIARRRRRMRRNEIVCDN